MANESLVGDLINFRGLVYAPVNENGVILLFGKVMGDLNMYIEEVKPGFPDCVARRFVGKGWKRVTIEFEFKSSNFKAHKHDPTHCDIIVCWEHDWKDCPLEVIELRCEIKNLENPPIERPGSGRDDAESEGDVTKILANVGAGPEIEAIYESIFDAVTKIDEDIWAKFGNRYVGWYSPERAFASVSPKKQSISIECFSRGKPIRQTKVSNERFSPRWCRFTVKSTQDIGLAVEILTEAHKRIKAALKAGEPTCYFSGGEGHTGGLSASEDAGGTDASGTDEGEPK